MSDKILRKLTVVLLSIALLSIGAAGPVGALETLDRSQGMSLTINDLPDGGLQQVWLYKIADMTDDIRFVFTKEYAVLEGKIDLDILVTDRQATSKWAETAEELLETYIPQLKTEPLAVQNYGDGTTMITFYDLEPGLYLVRGNAYENAYAGMAFDFAPMLVSVPYAADDSDELTYNVWSSAKLVEIPTTPTPTLQPTLTPTPYPTITYEPVSPTPYLTRPPITITPFIRYTPTPYHYPTYTPTPYRPPVPQTGETQNIWLPVVGIAAALAAIIAVVVVVKRRKGNE